jgi:hypothetical protein
MSDTDPNTDPEHIANLRERAEAAGKAEQTVAARDREIAFLQSGVNTGTTFGRMVMSEHGDGDVTPESIKAVVDRLNTELGIGTNEDPPPPPPGEPGTPEAQLTAASQALGAGAPAAGEPPPPPQNLRDIAVDAYVDARQHGQPEIEAQAVGIGAIMREAANGNPDAVWDQAKFTATARDAGHGAEFAGLPNRSMVKQQQG